MRHLKLFEEFEVYDQDIQVGENIFDNNISLSEFIELKNKSVQKQLDYKSEIMKLDLYFGIYKPQYKNGTEEYYFKETIGEFGSVKRRVIGKILKFLNTDTNKIFYIIDLSMTLKTQHSSGGEVYILYFDKFEDIFKTIDSIKEW